MVLTNYLSTSHPIGDIDGSAASKFCERSHQESITIYERKQTEIPQISKTWNQLLIAAEQF